jgi:asparagine synthase (glutamine-hydrolysing)
MCGIAGSLALRPGLPAASIDDLGAMIGALAHRGPDERGLYRDEWVGLAHARLSIVDLVSGQQPLCNEDESLWVIYNGEIYNHVELRPELEALGHRFRTHSDTEVIVHAWEAWGPGAFERFNGQFAIALWDAAARSLILARDRLGVRPLYLCEHGGRLWFASEVKALFAGDPGIPRALDPVGLAETFTFWAVTPPQSPFVGVTELEPGHVRTIGAAGTRDEAYWQPRFPVDAASTFRGSLEDATEAVRRRLEESVRLRMLRADVPVGSYLSGGLDSSLVAVLGQRYAHGPFQTFSIRFEDAGYDESPFQRLMARQLGSEHHEVGVTSRDIAAAFPEVVRHAEKPLLRTAPAPLFILSRLVRDSGIKVVLTGEGADEVFAGYDLFREAKVRRFWGRRPESTWRPLLLGQLYPYLGRSPVGQRAMALEYFGRDRHRWREPGFGHRTRWHSAAALQRLFHPQVRQAAASAEVAERLLASVPVDFPRWSHLAQDQYLEARTLLTGYLLSSQGDRMLMANSVEGRFPFLDRDLVELANTLPASFKLRGLEEKSILKRVAEDLVPADILRRPKQPYRAPDARAFVGPDGPAWIAHVLDPSTLADAGIFDATAVGRLWRKCQSQPDGRDFSNADNMALVGILSTGLLHDSLVKRGSQRVASVLPLTTLIDRVASRSPDRHV